MRTHRIPVGWPRRDPRHSRFPLPNVVWKYQLKPIAFVILSYLCCHSSHGAAKVLAPEVIAKGIHKSEATVRKHLSALEDAGLVKEPCSLAADFLSAESGKFFTLPNEIFLLNLPSSAFMVYAYLLLVENRRTHTCHPSYKTIATVTGMARNTVMKSIGVLLEKHLITMERSQYLDRYGLKWNGNNLYTILPTQRASRSVPPAAVLPAGGRRTAQEAPQTAGMPGSCPSFRYPSPMFLIKKHQTPRFAF